jgi:hypothetical protein
MVDSRAVDRCHRSRLWRGCCRTDSGAGGPLHRSNTTVLTVTRVVSSPTTWRRIYHGGWGYALIRGHRKGCEIPGATPDRTPMIVCKLLIGLHFFLHRLCLPFGGYAAHLHSEGIRMGRRPRHGSR